jgi:hypothetical protein
MIRGKEIYPWRVDVEVETVFLSCDFHIAGEESSLDTHRGFLGSVQHTGPWLWRLWSLSTKTRLLFRRV